jgi:heat-inducible transcriptional repressor
MQQSNAPQMVLWGVFSKHQGRFTMHMNAEQLTEREHLVLEAIIRNHILSALPTGSGFIARQKGFDLSSASIRNVMGELEERGFITQPHTSAGRVPTDKGYRYYVDRLMRTVDLPAQVKQQIRETFSRTGVADLHLLLEAATRTLSRVTQQLCVIIAPRLNSAVFRGLYVFPLGDRRYLMNVTIDAGLFKTAVFELDAEVAAADLANACHVLVDRFAGRTLLDLCESDPHGFDGVPRECRDAAAALLPPVRGIVDSDSRMMVHTEGEANVLLQPEFFNRDHADDVVRLCEATDRLADLLATASGEPKGNTVIAIGREIPQGARGTLHPFSIIKTGYRVGAMPGSLGVIGPKRMPYPYLISAVEYMARMLSEVRM